MGWLCVGDSQPRRAATKPWFCSRDPQPPDALRGFANFALFALNEKGRMQLAFSDPRYP
jgi:hypothetical protein